MRHAMMQLKCGMMTGCAVRLVVAFLLSMKRMVR